ncbi:MAG: sugar ABC transporter permease [Planctomycetes bacterium]|nr:sugar ABC transporter permease [Planctomycetota bacterium]
MRHGGRSIAGYVFVAPATLYLIVFAFLPMGVAAWSSLHRHHLVRAEARYVGLGNYKELAADPFFRNAAWNSLMFVGMAVPLGMILALVAALLVNEKVRGAAWFRTIFFIPAVSSLVALSMVWTWVYLPDRGLINAGLKLLGFSGDTDFLRDTRWALPALVFMSAWIGLGPRMIIFLAGLQGVPRSLHEAAELDGCGAWGRFRNITWPTLLPTTFFVFVTSTIACFKLFTEVYVMTQGGPRRTTDVLAYHIFKTAWTEFEVGKACAQSYVLFGIILLAALAQFAWMRQQVRQAEEGAAG